MKPVSLETALQTRKTVRQQIPANVGDPAPSCDEKTIQKYVDGLTVHLSRRLQEAVCGLSSFAGTYALHPTFLLDENSCSTVLGMPKQHVELCARKIAANLVSLGYSASMRTVHDYSLDAEGTEVARRWVNIYLDVDLTPIVTRLDT